MKLYLESGHYIDTERGMDVSLPLSNDDLNPRAWYVDAPRFEPVRANGFTGAVAEGGSVNFRNIYFNPHGHGTHTECLGHITREVHSVNQHLRQSFFKAYVLSLEPMQIDGDLVLTAQQFEKNLSGIEAEALLIRTLPNADNKKHRNYSATNPPYIETEALQWINQAGVLHLLIDLPSVDREEDGGKLAFHHAFWEVPANPRFDKTITEMIYVPDVIQDGHYLLNLQTAPFENDATPSRPVLFQLHETDVKR